MSTKITSERDYFTNLSLSDYPGHNVGNLATTALKSIKITQQGYAPPVDLGSKLLLKVSDTSCAYFNQRLFNNWDKALTLEQKYYLMDPKLIIQDSEYPIYGPVGMCSILHCEYGDFVILKMWNSLPP